MIALDTKKSPNGVYCTVQELFLEGQRAKDLDLHRLAKTTAINQGSRRSFIRGRGMEFFESRPYVPLDEMRTIDWKVSARLSKLYTKIFLEERERPIYLVVDLRPSMFFGSRKCFKSVMAARIAARLSTAAIHGGDQICGMLFDESLQKSSLGHSKQHVARWFGSLSRATTDLANDKTTKQFLDWPKILLRLSNNIKPGALIFLISDFQDLDEQCEPLLFRLRKKAQIFAISIFDSLEEHIPALGLVGMTFSGESVMFDSSNKTLTSSYESWWKNLQASNEKRWQKLGIPYRHVKTKESPDTILQSIVSGAPVRTYVA